MPRIADGAHAITSWLTISDIDGSERAMNISWRQRKSQLHIVIVSVVPKELLVRWDFLRRVHSLSVHCARQLNNHARIGCGRVHDHVQLPKGAIPRGSCMVVVASIGVISLLLSPPLVVIQAISMMILKQNASIKYHLS